MRGQPACPPGPPAALVTRRTGKPLLRIVRLLGADFVLGGSGHNAGVINPPAANKHGFWTNDDQPDDAQQWLASATRHEGSWWPWWTGWLNAHGSGKNVKARAIADGIEPAPGRYAMMP